MGGNAHYLADLCELEGVGRVVTVELAPAAEPPQHDRITYLVGSSTSDEIVAEVRQHLPAEGPVMVTLDSDHSADHVLQELQLYASMVTVGSYLIVEDTSVNGHPVWPSFGPGPFEAVEKFMATTDDFEVDPTMEKFMLTSNHRGFLQRVQETRAH